MTDRQDSSKSTDRIDLNDKAACESWAKKLNVTHEQMREAVGAVGDSASDVELHLKGVRSTSNDERVEKALRSGDGSSSDKPR
ncbi:DUF3606 domain-containing protein [Ramlibacter sp.]|uniref:DUF3606 domain-containing protein n=1 Tax=Ramlibacter sp. TaxID=1917967 RepID=UPI003D0CA03E